MRTTLASVFANDRLRLSVTDSCNFTCFYCTNEGQLHNHKTFLSPTWWSQLTKKIRDEEVYVRKLNITGGEPLVHNQLDRIIALGVDIAESVTLNTNGSLLSPTRVRELANLGLTNIKFGVDWMLGGATKPLLRKLHIDADQVLASLKAAVELMPRSSLNVVISSFNASRVTEIIDFVLGNNINKVELLELIAHDFRNIGTSSVGAVRAKDIVASMRDRFDRIEYNPRLAKYICWTREGLMLQVAEDFCLRRVCRHLWSRINARGQLVPCIKGGDTYSIDLSKPLTPQIRTANLLMCNSMGNSVPRSSDGRLLSGGEQGLFQPVDFNSLSHRGVTVTELDP
jgi:molybdenum cofactor biosynthesis enzyme MoaA